MQGLTANCLLLVALVGLVAGQAPPNASDPIRIDGAKGTVGHISPMGGVIRLSRDITLPGSNKTEKTGEITVTFDQLKEINANGSQVVDGSNRTHTIKTFADRNFICATNHNVTMPNSYNVTADCLFCWTNFKDFPTPTSFRINACFVKTNGTITQDDEISNVTIGQLKFSVEIVNGWSWCDQNCKGGAGEFLDLVLAIKMPPIAEKFPVKPEGIQEKFRPRRFDLGSGACVEFSTVFYADGAWKKLAQKTPSLVQNEGVNYVTLRFPRFTYNLLYDPTIDTGDKAYVPPGESSAGTNTAASSLLPIFLYAFIAVLCAFVTSY